jgi:hypothetical protein
MKALQTIIFVLMLAGFSNAAVFTVTRSDSRVIREPGGQTRIVPCDSVDCSLAEAVITAATVEGDDTIIFAPNVSTVRLDNTIYYDRNDINYPAKGALKIVGRGADVLTIVGGSPLFQIRDRNFSVSDVTLTGGRGGTGGAIYASGSLTLDGVHMVDNGLLAVYSQGGAVSFTGSLIIKNSTFSRNFANLCGAIDGTGTISIVNSTFSNNRGFGSPSGFGGSGSALCVRSGTTATIRNTTFTNNRSAGEGAILVLGGTMNFGNTIVAGNISNTQTFAPEISFSSGSIVSAGNNLIGDSAGDSTNTQNPITYQPSDKLDTPPLLGSLLNNGGQVPTHSLLTGSPLLDAGSNSLASEPFNSSALIYDQRGAGFSRLIDGNSDGTVIVDIGAFETQPVTSPTVSVAGRLLNSRGKGVSGAFVLITDSQGRVLTATTSTFGYYKFNSVTSGGDYTFEVRHTRYKFDVQKTNIRSDLTALNLTATP